VAKFSMEIVKAVDTATAKLLSRLDDN
jgi:hypothetical protein